MSMFEIPLTDEQRAALEKARMKREDVYNRWRRYFVELDVEQLKMLDVMLSSISNSDNPGATARFYEGMITGSRWYHELVIGDEVPETPDPDSP